MHRQIIDLSIAIEKDVISDPAPFNPKVEYFDHEMTAGQMAAFFPGLTKDDLPDGERRGGGNSGSMHHGFEDIIAFISQSETLYPGKILGSGTVGTGCGFETGRYLEDGDVVELEIEKIGVLRNPVRKTG